MVTQQERDACAQAIQADPVAVSNALLDEIARLRGDVRYYKGLHDAFLEHAHKKVLDEYSGPY